jgi:hypothetical protein
MVAAITVAMVIEMLVEMVVEIRLNRLEPSVCIILGM